MPDFYIVQVYPADDWGGDYCYCFHDLDNARAKVADLAQTYDLEVQTPDCAIRFKSFDENHEIKMVALTEGRFED